MYLHAVKQVYAAGTGLLEVLSVPDSQMPAHEVKCTACHGVNLGLQCMASEVARSI